MDDHPEDAEDLELPDTLYTDQLDSVTDEHDKHDVEDQDEQDEEPHHNALPRRLESWRSRSATGAVISAMAMGLRQVFEPEQRRPAIVAEAPSDPYDEDDPVVVDYVADDASGTKVILRPWLMPGAEPEARVPDAPRATQHGHEENEK